MLHACKCLSPNDPDVQAGPCHCPWVTNKGHWAVILFRCFASNDMMRCPALRRHSSNHRDAPAYFCVTGHSKRLQKSCSKKQSSATLTSVTLDSVLPHTGHRYARVHTNIYIYIYINIYIYIYVQGGIYIYICIYK